MTHLVDDRWQEALPHRSGSALTDAVARLEGAGVGPSTVAAVLRDLGENLWRTRAGGDLVEDPLSGAEARLVVLTELAAFLTASVERAACLRRQAVEELNAHESLSAIARRLGVSPQAVHKLLRRKASVGSAKYPHASEMGAR
ncbi:hypothetical protein [Actinotalea subterranea]|uniref:hypothetical protein n=1 Tax=Actinotalea subterranea TaxID=2607497 RepID=UPI0011EE9BF6|nr:hypothetical protein [Actinotalea subterranea]